MTTLTIVRCDVCGRELGDARGPRIDWLCVERSSDVLRVQDDPGPWDVCSWSCLSDLGKQRGKRTADDPRLAAN